MDTMSSVTNSEITSTNTEPTMSSTATPVPETPVIEPPLKQQTPKTIRIHVNITNQARPVIFNYRQLYKRELKKCETTTEPIAPTTMEAATIDLPLDSKDDLFYKELLKKAESYAMDEDDVDDDGSDEEANVI